MWKPTVVLVVVLVSQAYTAPQFITFNDGKLGVNFGGYHAAVGIGGLLGGNNGGTGGGLFAEAGTPYGQGAKAGLGGSVDANGGTSGGLFAGATAGNNIKASTGLAGGVNSDKTGGFGFASAQSGGLGASSGMGGSTSTNGGSGFTFSGSNSFGVMNDFAVKPVDVKPHHKKPHKEFDFDALNEVNFVPLKTGVATDVTVEPVPAVAVKEVQTYYKPRHHLKTAYFGDEATVAHKEPVLEKRIDVGVEGASDDKASADVGGGVYTKGVVYQRNPNFFADIFNIPISTLKAVGNFLGNTAASTSVSVQKSASVQGDSEPISSKHVPSSSTSLSSSSDTEISVKTPAVSKVIEDIFSIPINTLSAVNKFLENNVPSRKAIQVSQDGGETIEKRHARVRPHLRRRANNPVNVPQEQTVDVVKNDSSQ